MSLLEAYRAYKASKAVCLRSEAIQIEKALDIQGKQIEALNAKLGALEAIVKGSDNRKLHEQLNSLKAVVDKLSSRLLGFSKTGIS